VDINDDLVRGEYGKSNFGLASARDITSEKRGWNFDILKLLGTIPDEVILTRDSNYGEVIHLGMMDLTPSQIEQLSLQLGKLQLEREEGKLFALEDVEKDHVAACTWEGALNDKGVIILFKNGEIKAGTIWELQKEWMASRLVYIFSVCDGIKGKGPFLILSVMREMQKLGVRDIYWEVGYVPSNVDIYRRILNLELGKDLVECYWEIIIGKDAKYPAIPDFNFKVALKKVLLNKESVNHGVVCGRLYLSGSYLTHYCNDTINELIQQRNIPAVTIESIQGKLGEL